MTKNLDLHAFAKKLSSTPGALPVYCLADHAGVPGLHKKLVRAQSEWRSLFGGTREEGALSVAPILFRIDPGVASQRGVLTWLEEHGTFSSALLFVTSLLEIDALASCLSKRLDARISEEVEVLLRYYDPRIFEQLLNVFSPPQRADFLCCAKTWWFVGRTGELHEVSAEFEMADSFLPPLRLSADQELALLDACENDQVIEQLKAALPDLYSALPPSERYEFVSRHVTAAQQLKISATHELALFCAIALTTGDDFSSKPMWDEILCKVNAGEVSFSDAVAQLDA
jgi:hypothetical protein